MLQDRIRLAVLVAICLLPPSAVLANSAAPWMPGAAVGEPMGALQQVAIVSEDLVIDMLPLAREDGMVNVQATYLLRNLGPALEIELVFVAPAIENGVVVLGGQTVESDLLERQVVPEQWRPPAESPSLEGGEQGYRIEYLGFRYNDERHADLLKFHVNLSPGEQELSVSYDMHPPTIDVIGPYRTYQVGYVLSPARSWQSFGTLRLEIKAPEDWDLAVSVPVERSGDHALGVFEGLPADVLAISAHPPVGSVSVFAASATPILGLLLAAVFAVLLGRAPAHRVRQAGLLKKIGIGLAAGSVTAVVTVVLAIVSEFAGLSFLEAQHLAGSYSYSRTIGMTFLSIPGAFICFWLAVGSFFYFARKIQRVSGDSGQK